MPYGLNWIVYHGLPIFLQISTLWAIWYVYKHRRKLMITEDCSPSKQKLKSKL